MPQLFSFPSKRFCAMRHAVANGFSPRYRYLWIWGPLLTLGLFNAVGQQPVQANSPQVVRPTPQDVVIPDYVLYHQFFRHLLYLDQQAANHRSATATSGEVRNSYQTRLRFGSDQFAKVRSSAGVTEQKVAILDAQAKAIVTAFRAQHNHVSASEPLPPPPPELAQLQQQRNALIKTQIAQLKDSLGSQDATQLDAFLRSQFAPHVRIATIGGATRSHNPTLHPVAPFERIR